MASSCSCGGKSIRNCGENNKNSLGRQTLNYDAEEASITVHWRARQSAFTVQFCSLYSAVLILPALPKKRARSAKEGRLDSLPGAFWLGLRFHLGPWRQTGAGTRPSYGGRMRNGMRFFAAFPVLRRCLGVCNFDGSSLVQPVRNATHTLYTRTGEAIWQMSTSSNHTKAIAMLCSYRYLLLYNTRCLARRTRRGCTKGSSLRFRTQEPSTGTEGKTKINIK